MPLRIPLNAEPSVVVDAVASVVGVTEGNVASIFDVVDSVLKVAWVDIFVDWPKTKNKTY